MEYLDGETLAERLEKGALPLDQALTIAIEIADALDKAHRQGIVHRDLKPGNIILTKTGAKLLDFGLAKPTAMAMGADSAMPTMSEGLTGQGAILGTLQYMAPEQLEGEDVDARTDIFAFGTVVYEMITGEKTFSGKSQASMIAAILEREPTPISELQPVSPPALDRVVKKCLAKDPERRWHSAHDLHDELTWVVEAGADATVAAMRSSSQPVGRWSMGTLVAAVVVASTLVGLGVWSLARSGPPAPQSLTRFTISPPASDELFVSNLRATMALSEDGQTLVYVATRDGVQQLYRRPLDQLNALPIPGTEGASSPFFAPDGEWIGFEVDGALRRMAVTGGPAATLYEGTLAATDVSWGTNDMIMFGLSTDGNPLMQVASTGGVAEPVTTLEEGETDHRQPALLPGGTAFLFAVASGPDWSIAVKSLDTGERRVLFDGSSARYVATGHIVFAREDALWAVPFNDDQLSVTGDAVPVMEGVAIGTTGYAQFAVAGNVSLVYVPGTTDVDARTLVWVDRDGREEAIPAPTAPYESPRLSPDEQNVAVEVRDPANADVIVFDLQRETSTGSVATFGITRESPLGGPRYTANPNTLWIRRV